MDRALALYIGAFLALTAAIFWESAPAAGLIGAVFGFLTCFILFREELRRAKSDVQTAVSHPEPGAMRSERSERATSLLPVKEGE